MTKRPFKKLRRQYEISIAKAKLEFAESGDNDKLWNAINDRQDKRDNAIYAALLELDAPASRDELWELTKFIEMFLDEHNQIGIQSRDADLLAKLVRQASRGLIAIGSAEDHAKWEAEKNVKRAAA